MMLHYLAGLFDGEGYFTIRASAPTSVNMGRRPLRLQAMTALTIKEEYVCEMFAREFGGYVREFGTPRKPTHSLCHIWCLTGPKIVDFCDKLIPILTVKRERALAMREFQLLKSSFGNRSLTDEQYEKSICMYEEFRNLNKKGPK